VRHAEHNTRTPIASTGFFAMLCALLDIEGTGASKASRGSGAPLRRGGLVTLAVLAAMLVALALTAVPALAAAPEVASEFTSPTALPSGEANLEAAVNPENEPTECHFQYGETIVTEHEVACTEPAGGIVQGVTREQLASVNVKGLKAGTTYHYRVVLKNASGKAEGAPAEVTTAAIPSTEVPNPIGATTATFKGELTPLNGNVATEYFFFYNVGEEAFCLNEHETGRASAGKGSGVADVTMAVSGLEPSQKYTVCAADTNVFGGFEESLTPKHFETLAAPPDVIAESEHAFEVKATEAMLSAGVNPNNQSTTYKFEYATNAALTENIVSIAGGSALSGYNLAGEPAGVALSGLTPHKAYYYRVIAENAKDEKAIPGKVESFVTGPLETPVSLEASPVGTTTVTLKGVLNPSNAIDPGSYEFLYRQSATECTGAGASGGSALGSEKEAVETNIEGLLPGVTYTVCLRAHHETEEQTSAPVTFTTHAAPPQVEQPYVTDVASSSATLLAKVNPQGAPTTYTFEYAPQGGTFTPVAETEGSGTLPEGDSAVGVSVHVQYGLLPGTSYEFRVVAHNSAATVTGTAASFVTLPPSGGGYALPDSRQWELVSPPDKHGALLEPIDLYGLIQSSTEGNAFTYITSAPTESEPQGNANAAQIFATRGTDGWSSKDITPPNEISPGVTVGNGQEYRLFSSDLSRAIFESRFLVHTNRFTTYPGEETSPHATEATPYLRENFSCPSVTCYTPLLTTTDVTSGVKYGQEANAGGFMGAPEDFEAVLGATPDLSHVVLATRVPLLKVMSNGLYEWSAGEPPAEQLQIITILPESEGGGLAQDSTFASGSGGGHETRNAISSNGSRIVWSTGGYGQEHLYMRDTALEETVRLDLPEPECLKEGTCGSEYNEPRFDMASSDGSVVFFTDTQRLTADSRAADQEGSEPDLYACEMVEVQEAGRKKLKCDLTDLSPDSNPGEERAAVQGSVVGASEDGSFVYFVADGVLGDGAERGASKGDCRRGYGEPGDVCNLYVEHYNNGGWEAPRFIAAISGPDVAHDASFGDLRRHTAGASPDGRYLAFMSERDLTGYDTADAASGEPDEEVYLYHAETSPSGQLQPGKLVCASCNPTGARPVGEEYGGEDDVNSGLKINMRFVGGYEVWENEQWLAANIPGWADFTLGYGAHQPRYLSDNGRLFFNSHEALVPADVNGTWDVYEYEPPGNGGEGEGDCTTSTRGASDVYNPKAGGCVGLISSGESSEESAFLDASESGGDVFFATLSQLVPQDVDHSYDVYDAHECTTKAPCFPASAEVPSPCTTEASCKASPTPQPGIYGAPASATFSGPGNLVPSPSPVIKKVTTKKKVKCKQGFVKSKKGRCVQKKRSNKKAKKSSKANRGGKS
jgi:hypothetical protein